MNTDADHSSMVDSTTSGTPVTSDDTTSSEAPATGRSRRRTAPRPAKRAAGEPTGLITTSDPTPGDTGEGTLDLAAGGTGDAAVAPATGRKRAATKRTAAKRASSRAADTVSASATSAPPETLSTEQPAQPSASEVVAAELAALAAGATAAPEPAAPARRRATRKRATVAPADAGDQAAPAEATPDQAAPAGAGEAGAPAAKEPKRTATRRGGRRKAAEPVAEPVAEPAQDGATAGTDAAAAPGSGTDGSGTDGSGKADGPGEAPAASAPVEASAQTAPAEPAPSGRRRRGRAVPPPFEPPVAPAATAAPGAQAPEAEGAKAAGAEKPAAEAARRTSGALATTMLLFQPPPTEPAAPRRRRAASRPAGPPQLQTSFGADARAEEPPTAVEPAAETAEEAAAPAEAEDATTAETIELPDGTVVVAGAPAVTDRASDAEAEEDEETDEDELAEADETEEAEEAEEGSTRRRRRRRGGRGRRGRNKASSDAEGETEGAASQAAEPSGEAEDDEEQDEESDDEGQASSGGSRRRRRRRRRGSGGDADGGDDPPNTVTRVREPRRHQDDVTALKGSTRLEAKKQRRREGRETGRRRQSITEAEFLARRESVERVMVVRERDGRTQIGVLEDGVLVEHYVARRSQTTMVGNVYLGKVQNVLASMEAAFVDVGKGRNAVLYAGEVNWDAAGLDGQPKRIEHALKSGESVLVQVTKDPIGHKGARLTSQISLPGRFLVYVPNGSMTGISRKLPDNERNRLKKILREIVPDDAGVIVRTAAEGASEEELTGDVARLKAQWEDIERKARTQTAPALLYGEPDLAIRVVRDIFNEDFRSLVVDGPDTYETLQAYLGHVAPDLVDRLSKWDGEGDVFAANRIDEQLAKAMDRKVWLPSGGSLVIDRTEAMTVVDVNTGKFTGSGGNLEETVTKNNIEAAEEIVRQLRLRDIGGIIVIDFIDMVLESNRDLVLRRLLECLGRDRTKHQVAEVTSLGLVQMTRKRVGQGLLEVFSEPCEHCGGRGLIIHDEPVEKRDQAAQQSSGGGRSRGSRGHQHVAASSG